LLGRSKLVQINRNEKQRGENLLRRMLILGNIPNIIAANKLKISSRAWAVPGALFGLILTWQRTMRFFTGIKY
jgi:hypothetical protein